MPDRRAEIAANLQAVEARIGAACAAAGRPREAVTLVAVTKTFPAGDVGHLAALGLRDVAESRDQEAGAKAAQCAAAGLTGLRWHFVGQLQTNKARSVLGYSDVVHSVDRPRLVQALERAAAEGGRTPVCLVQVDLEEDAAAGRGGVPVSAVCELADRVAASAHLRLGGLMAVAPRGADPDAAFARLADVADGVRAAHPHATVVSAGMSGDLESAVRHGATHLRVGSALLGSRPPLG
jgi:pyridoxal phosphate enzyme (YggS family)